MIHRTIPLSLLLSATSVVMFFGTAQSVDSQSAETFDEVLSQITHGRPISPARVSIASDSIVKESEPLLVTVEINPSDTVKDEVVVFYLLMSEGPWPKAYTAMLRTRNGHAHFATRLRVPEDCTLHALAEIDGEKLFGATQEVKVSAGAYTR